MVENKKDFSLYLICFSRLLPNLKFYVQSHSCPFFAAIAVKKTRHNGHESLAFKKFYIRKNFRNYNSIYSNVNPTYRPSFPNCFHSTKEKMKITNLFNTLTFSNIYPYLSIKCKNPNVLLGLNMC